jgi:hypothetical protein
MIMFKRNRKQAEAKEAALNHRQSLIKNLEHRLEVARANGDQALIAKLEAEARYLHLN